LFIVEKDNLKRIKGTKEEENRRSRPKKQQPYFMTHMKEISSNITNNIILG